MWKSDPSRIIKLRRLIKKNDLGRIRKKTEIDWRSNKNEDRKRKDDGRKMKWPTKNESGGRIKKWQIILGSPQFHAFK